MRFSKLRLTGFKSFVDPTDLVIGEGLTGVVGPNGCGKSNLLEALRWVMGENRPTAMRGGGMEDVIFAGAATRPARNFAEVSLLIDNSERLAPAGFNDSDSLEITRRITHDIGSAYKMAGKDVRARDVALLFADASTGAHSPALVRQGQISELINAKPKGRRRMLEEAAGISGLYQRRHEAELKLRSTETNLSRLDDLIEQLAAQLSQLARQARQAARYRAIGTELRQAEGLLLYRRWQDADKVRLDADGALREKTTLAARAEKDVRVAAKARESAESAVPPKREEEAIAAALCQRLAVERDQLDAAEARAAEAIETLQRRLRQLTQDIDREAGLNRDAGETIERLEWEAQELDKASAGQDDVLLAARETLNEANRVMQAREADLAEKTEEVARLAARHQAGQRFLEDSEKLHTRAKNDAEKAQANKVASRDTRAKALNDAEGAKQAAAKAQDLANRAEDALVTAENNRSETQSREATARAERSEAEGEANALRAEAGALAKLLERDTAEGGQIMDRLQVEHGFEKALGAALADDLRAPQVDSDGPSGWTLLDAYINPKPLPAGVTPLSHHVSVPDVLQRRLDQIGLVAADDGPQLHGALAPGQRLVSLEGDLWRWDGFRAWAEDAPSTAALRLEQLNRLETLKQALEAATNRMDAARAAHEALATRLKDLTEADRAARDARRLADKELNDAVRTMNRAEADADLAAGRLESAELAATRHEDEATAASAQVAEARRAVNALPDLAAARGVVDDLKTTLDAARITMMARRAEADDLKRAADARVRRRQEVTKELSGWRHRLETANARAEELTVRRAQTQEELVAAEAAPETLVAERARLNDADKVAQARLSAGRDALAGAEAALREASIAERDAERTASEAREVRAAAQARLEAANEALSLAAARIAEEHEATPRSLADTLGEAAHGDQRAEAIEADVNRLKRQRDALGAVNLRAEEDAKEVQTEHDTLHTEKADLEEAIKTLRSGIASLNREGRERLLTAFEEVNRNFGTLFAHLFGGGEAKLVLVESEDPLDAGLEIMCQPPGKKLSTLSLLSGGEQTLTALALIFAVFLANPAPICVLDEVDAPLDDANVTRFCDLLDEMCRRTDTRFLIITHHAVTMSRMDRLFGVTMAEQGVSQLVSVDLKKAETLVA
ncbi:MAG: chromosome segregation protein SMC [Marinovum sp.]|nr:chromosome segregation protein SMC [Marinovum sp.]